MFLDFHLLLLSLLEIFSFFILLLFVQLHFFLILCLIFLWNLQVFDGNCKRPSCREKQRQKQRGHEMNLFVRAFLLLRHVLPLFTSNLGNLPKYPTFKLAQISRNEFQEEKKKNHPDSNHQLPLKHSYSLQAELLAFPLRTKKMLIQDASVSMGPSLSCKRVEKKIREKQRGSKGD